MRRERNRPDARGLAGRVTGGSTMVETGVVLFFSFPVSWAGRSGVEGFKSRRVEGLTGLAARSAEAENERKWGERIKKRRVKSKGKS